MAWARNTRRNFCKNSCVEKSPGNTKRLALRSFKARGYFLGHAAVTRQAIPRRLWFAGISSSSSDVDPSFLVQSESVSELVEESSELEDLTGMTKTNKPTSVASADEQLDPIGKQKVPRRRIGRFSVDWVCKLLGRDGAKTITEPISTLHHGACFRSKSLMFEGFPKNTNFTLWYLFCPSAIYSIQPGENHKAHISLYDIFFPQVLRTVCIREKIIKRTFRFMISFFPQVLRTVCIRGKFIKWNVFLKRY